VVSPIRAVVLREFQRHKMPLQYGSGVAGPSRRSADGAAERGRGVPAAHVRGQRIRQGILHEVKVREMNVDRQIRLVYPARRVLRHTGAGVLGSGGGMTR